MALDSQAQAFLVGAQESAHIMPDRGRIVAITNSLGGRTGSWQPWVAMGAAKSAQDSLVRYFAVALAPRGITVNGISPGGVFGQPNALEGVSCAFYRKGSRRRSRPGTRAAGPRWADWAPRKISATLPCCYAWMKRALLPAKSSMWMAGVRSSTPSFQSTSNADSGG